MLDATEALLRERGLSGAGIKDIVERGRAPIGSLYHFFPAGKTELASLALQRHAEKAGRLIDGFFAGDAPIAERVRALFRNAARGFDQSGANKGCAIGAVTLDLGADDEEIRAVCAAAFDDWVTRIARRLPWRSAKARRSFAEMVVIAIEGAFVLGRARRSGQPFIVAGEWLAAAADTVAAEGK
jgi:AcrR family transcriptional regulator